MKKRKGRRKVGEEALEISKGRTNKRMEKEKKWERDNRRRKEKKRKKKNIVK